MGIMDLEKMANFIADKMSSVEVKSQQCAKIRSPLSKCSKCQDICPQQRIMFSAQKITLADNCLECGLCASVCPTGALALKEPGIMAILNKIEQTYKNDGVVNISCRRNSSVDEKCIKISCIGALMPELLLVMRLYDFSIHMVYTEEQCRACAVKGGIDLFNTRMAQVDELIEEFSLAAHELIQIARPEKNKTKEPAKKHEEIDMQKRALFGSVFSGFRKMPEVVLQSYVGADNKKETATAPKSRATDHVMIDRIEILKKYVYEKIPTDHEFNFLQQPRLTSKCYLCKACTILCPTGALEYRAKDGEIILNSSRCSGCSLCADVCYPKSLQLMPVSLESVVTTPSISLVKGYTNICEECKQEFVASEALVQCSKCQARARFKQ